MVTARPYFQRQFGAFANRNYRLFFFGQATSLMGTWMQSTAQAWLVLQISGSALALGTVLMLQFLPVTCLTLFGGVIADRLPKRRVLIGEQASAMVQAAVLGTLVATGRVELWHVYACALWVGFSQALDGPVRQSFVMEMVGREQLANAVAMNATMVNMAKIAGPAVAGLIIGLVGNEAAFFANSASYIAVIAAYACMRQSELHPVARKPAVGGIFQQLGEGLRYTVSTPDVLFLFIMMAAFGTFGFNYSIVVPLIGRFILDVDAEQFGLLTTFLGAGSFLAALGLATLGMLPTRGMALGGLVFGLMFVFLALSRSFLVTGLLLAGLGLTGQILLTTLNTRLQLGVPDELRGRVMSIYFFFLVGTTPLGGYLTGVLGDTIGVPLTLVIEGALCLAGFVAAFAYRAVTARNADIPRPGPLPEVRTA